MSWSHSERALRLFAEHRSHAFDLLKGGGRYGVASPPARYGRRSELIALTEGYPISAPMRPAMLWE